ncbi:PEP-CTERM sorting domain-containing protein [Ideonella sp. BN130291]|uniref:PEP-CTERM sorting domain-containing protein n=1 Tax=Ideonella sp. BN130291 TaxID=3112940 RepID=UPI002E25E017|nr:PEP-CTERM sorting domain-containing protein [Ideonella sp. BN130291]
MVDLKHSCLALAAAAALVFSGAAQAQIVNGGFEAGLTGWTVVDQLGSEGTFFVQAGTTSPVNGASVPAPPQGVQAAMTDAAGPGSHVLYQDFIVPTVAAGATLSFQLYVRSEADFVSPGHLDFAGVDLNQQVRVDLLSAAGDPFSTSVLMNLVQTQPGDPLVSGYSLHQFEVGGLLKAHAGETLRLRFAEVDNVFIQNLGVDAVALVLTPVPEPATAGLAGLGLAVLLLARRWLRRRR